MSIVVTGASGQLGRLVVAELLAKVPAGELSRQSGRHVPYRPVTVEEYAAQLSGAGLPDQLARVMAGIDASIEAGELDHAPGDLSRLAARPATPVADAIAAALAE